MADLIYSAIASLDGYVEDAHGRFEWAEPDEEVFGFLNDLERSVGTHLYGRRMYETMRYWETTPTDEDEPQYLRDWAHAWRSAEKVVFSGTLDSVSTARTRIERSFDPQEVRRLKTTAGKDLIVGGAQLAGHAVQSGLVDELQLFVAPVVVGGGKAWLPERLRLRLELLESRPFSSGFVFLRYRPATAP
jgi:dihydrofolate reductase